MRITDRQPLIIISYKTQNVYAGYLQMRTDDWVPPLLDIKKILLQCNYSFFLSHAHLYLGIS
jgi:hypothetical protein